VRNDDLERGRSLVPAAVTVLVTALVVLASVGSGAVGAPQAVERPGTTPGSAASTGIDAGNGGPVDAGRDGTSGPASEAVTVRSATETARPATETAAVAPAGFTPGDPSPANLLANPGCEAAGETGAPDGWTDQSPNGRSVYCTYVDGADDDGSDLTTQRAPEGPLAIADGRPDGETKVLVQTVPVTAGRAYEVAGWVGTDDALSSADYGEVEVRYLDGSGAPIGTAVTRSSLRSDTDDAFDRFSAVSTAPSGAASAQVRLELVNADATGHAAVFVDGLTVRRTGPGPTASDDLLSVAAGGSLSPAATLFADSAHGTDRRGGSAATVASFGGGDLGGTVTDNAPGSTVPLAGGDLTVTADGSLSLAAPTEGGTYAFDYRLASSAGSDDARAFVAVRAPEITVVGNGSEVASGDATPSRADGTDFGAVPVEGGTATATFEVRNDGLRELVLDGRTPVNVTGPNAGEFAVTAQPATTVPAGGSTTVAVAFDPTGVDERTATLSIRSTDASEDPYAVAVAGVGTDELTATTGAATDVTPTAATLPGVVDPGGRTTTVAVDYWPTGSPGAATTITANESPVAGVRDLSVSARATGLTPATNYTYRVVATNPNGTATGANRTVETPVAPPTATTLAATGATTSAATLRGTVTPGGGATTVAFRYYPVGRPAAATTVPANRTPVGGTTTLAVNATVGGLAPETTYAYRVTAANAAGSDEGAILRTTTRSEPPVLVATGPFAANETAPNGTVVGDVDATDGEGGAVDDNVTYALAGATPAPDPDGDGTPAFAIDADDGRLRVADADDLDHEANASSALEVRVDDDAGRTTNATVTVDVRDVAPTLATQSLGAVGDAAPAGTVVGTVDAGGDDTSVSYRIADGNPAVDGDGTPAFSIDAATGEVAVADPDDLDAGTATAVDLAVEVTDGTTPASATVSLSVTDTTAPTADAGGNRTVEVGQSTVLDATGSTDNVALVAHEWDVGDDGTVDATGSTVNYTFDAVGETVVALTVTDAAGNAATDTATVTVEDTTPPDVPAVPNRTVDEDVPVAFDASGTTDEGTVASYEWAFGDGSANATGATVSHTYAQPGTYVVVLTVTDGAGNVARERATVVVRDVTPPEARLTANRTSVLTGGAVRFDAGNSTDNVGIETYAWDLDGDGTTDATGPNATWTSATPGTYAVTLTATDAAGNADTAAATVRVDAPGNVTVDLLGTTAPVAAGEPLNATVRVENVGTRSATQDLTLAANGTTVATRSVTLAAGASRRVTLSWATRDGDGGSYLLSVASANDTASTSVVVVPPNPFPDGLPGQRSVTPRDVDGDVRYEDVDGNGRVDVGDAITLLFADWATINGNPAQRAALDFDGDGRVGFLDVVTLLFE
jgi:PKD repeat protein